MREHVIRLQITEILDLTTRKISKGGNLVKPRYIRFTMPYYKNSIINHTNTGRYG